MKDKIIHKATEMFLKLGFKSVTMDDIACEMCISKKTIYKYFQNKEVLIEEGTEAVHQQMQVMMNEIVEQKYNAIAENFEFRKRFKKMFQSVDHSPAYQLKKHYPEYLNLLYIVDVPEEQIKQLDGSDLVQLAEEVAFVLLKREWQKVWYRAKYSS